MFNVEFIQRIDHRSLKVLTVVGDYGVGYSISVDNVVSDELENV